MREYLDLLQRNVNYRYLWWGNVVSLLGDWFTLIASAALITELTNSGVAISYLFLARFLPLFLFSPLAGVLADRYDRKKMMIVTDVLRAVTVLGFLLVGVTGQVWLLYFLTVVQFALSSLFTPARTAVLAMIVPEKDLVTANALDSFTWSTMLALGALLGGIVAAIFGARTAFVLDAGTYLLSALLLVRIVLPKRTPRSAETGQSGWLDFVQGFKYVVQRPFLLGISLVKAGGSLVWGAINVLEVKYAEEIFALSRVGFLPNLRIEDPGTATLGLIYLISGLGTGLGPLFMRHWLGDSRRRLLQGIGVGFLLMLAGIAGLAFAPTLGIFLLFTFVRTVGSGTIWVFSAVLLQVMVPDEYRGRVFAFEFAALTLTQSLSIFVAGFAIDSLDWTAPQVMLAFAWLGVLVTVTWGVFYSMNRSRPLPSSQEPTSLE